MKFGQVLFAVVLSVIASVGVVSWYHRQEIGQSKQESAYERVLRTKTLRCGYADWPPYVFKKDPTTDEVSGILVDATQAIADRLKLKLEWTENTGWGSFIESLQSHRIDAFCAGVWRNAERGRYIGYTSPIFYSAVYPYVRADDHRFDKDLSLINQPDVRISTMDGEMSDMIAKLHFPKATPVSIPQLGQITDIYMNVATRKADIVFNEPSIADDFMKSNPNTLRRAQDVPFEFFPTSLCVEIRENALREMLDSATIELHNQGVIEDIISRYSKDPKVFLRVAKPYANG
ncbi:MAG: transporter substrate-binding domain-containing protein [Alphaproteobacteria bacterium]|nr:transporter substrate-binding domain-containing protein [Alphaproteobacteria bacterium]